MEKLNSMPQFTARLSRQPHNAGQSFAFTCSTGMLLPLYQDVLHPDDTVYLNDKFFARINNPVTAALGQIDFHLDWFFVPATMIFTPFGSMMYDTNDLVSSSLVSNNGIASYSEHYKHYPYLNLDNLFQYLNGLDSEWYTKNLGYVENQPQLAFPYFGCAGNNIFRLLNHLEYNPYEVFNRIPSSESVPNPHFGVARNPASFPWALATYQCIYQHYFRNDDREPKEYFSWQLDSFWGSPSFPNSTAAVDNNHLLKYIVQLRFANCYKDYFTSVKVSPVQSSVSNLFNAGDGQSGYLDKIDNWLGLSDHTFRSSNSSGNPVTDDGAVTQVALQNTSAKLTSSNIRSVFALEKLLRIVGRADKNYESQVLAHFGFKIPHDVLHNITHIGHDMATMELSPILSTANTFNGDTGSGLGEVGGNGVISFSGRRRQFKAPCHGFLMCIMHCKPRYRYFGTFSKLNMISTRLDFYQPEFDKLGMQPLFAYEANGMRFNQTSQNYRYGWQYRYEQFKRKYNRVSEAFATSHAYTDSAGKYPMVNSWSPWVIAKRPFDNVNANVNTGVYWNAFLSTAIDIDSILQVHYNPYWSNDYLINPHLIFQTDPFICDFTADVKKVNSMSEYGEPDL